MNYEENKINWKDGDLVIHDCDAKRKDMLMKVVGTITTKGKKVYKCEYINEEKRNQYGLKKVFCNPKECLHDPKRFNINCVNCGETE